MVAWLKLKWGMGVSLGLSAVFHSAGLLGTEVAIKGTCPFYPRETACCTVLDPLPPESAT